MKVLGAVGVILALLVSGCAGSGGQKDESDAPEAMAGRDAATRGGPLEITGTVTDIAVQPLAGASVTLLPGGRETATRSDGTYRFGALAPGKYRVQYEAQGFVAAARGVELVNASARIDVQLLDAPSTDPFVEGINVTGFIECAAGAAGAFASCVALTPNFGGVGNPTNEKIVVPFETRPNLTALRITMAWEPGVPGTAGEMTLLLEQSGTQGESGFEHARASGASPAVLEFDAAGLAQKKLAGGATLQTRTFPGSENAPAVAVQQAFDLAFEFAYFGATL